MDEIEKTQFLRATGIFFRENVDANVMVLTPWPGSIGYLSHLDVRDLRGRATALPGEERLRSWRRPGRIDLVEALGMGAGYVILKCRPNKPRERVPQRAQLAKEWNDELGESVDSLGEVYHALEQYELVTVPLLSPARTSSKRLHGKAYILRHKGLGQAPKLQLSLEGRTVVVSCSHEAHDQLADLRLTLQVPQQTTTWRISPIGEPSKSPHVLARRELLLTRTGVRPLELMRLELPEEGWSGGRLSATLINPGASATGGWGRVSNTETQQIP
jgi:hypothetical protein